MSRKKVRNAERGRRRKSKRVSNDHLGLNSEIFVRQNINTFFKYGLTR